MGDLISRQAAIKAICEDGTWLESQGCTDISMAERKQRDADILSDLPSAQTERKKGEWILKPNIYGVAYCSECDYELHTDNTNYCPNCGAWMGGEEDG